MKEPVQQAPDCRKDFRYYARPITKRHQTYYRQYPKQLWLLLCVWTRIKYCPRSEQTFDNWKNKYTGV